ncbi:PTS sugar transporter subunit IIA [Haemophilus influenzae]|uniref:PTS sugar transporter subunit IIA n=1 Tax=Haemophilus influenzae TaxID=727 RepID=UPI003B43D0A6
MLELSESNIHLNANAIDKQQAIEMAASALVQAGNVENGYLQGMLARELANLDLFRQWHRYSSWHLGYSFDGKENGCASVSISSRHRMGRRKYCLCRDWYCGAI